MKVSAICPVYDAERFIEGWFEDLMQQTILDELEIIMVDTASPGREGEIATNLALKHGFERFHYIRTEAKRTPAGAANLGIPIAEGEYIALANADDRHRPDALEILAERLDSHLEISVVYAHSGITATDNAPWGSDTVGTLSLPPFRATTALQGCIAGPAPMYRRSLHDKYGLFDPALLGADFEWWMRLASKGEQFMLVDEILGLYLKSPKGFEMAHYDAMQDENVRLRGKYAKALERARVMEAG